MLGDFVGLQVTLDVGDFEPTWFDAKKVLGVGPGAVSPPAKIYSGLPVSDKGMVTDPQSRMAAVPFIHRLQVSLDDNENEHVNALMREAADFAGTPRMPDLNTIEYWLCENRQLEEKSRPRDWRAADDDGEPRL